MTIKDVNNMTDFLKDTAERAVKTAAETAIALIGTAKFVSEIDVLAICSGVLVATVLSVLASIASYNAGTTGTASMVD